MTGRIPSHARPHKPPAGEIHAHRAAALGTGGGRLPPALREHFDAEPDVVRTKPSRAAPHGPATTSTRAGKRVPRSAKGPRR